MSAGTGSAFDRHMMTIALAMARRGLGQTAPNPAVGAVIVDPTCGEVIARGWTQPGGRPHAETEALARAGERARGCTLYVTLEPCSHHGRTPPCADAVIAAGVARVVCAIEDPDPRVAGRGLDRLRGAGIAVERGLCAETARWLTRGHIVRVTERRPLVQLKMALSADGSVLRGTGAPTWVTGPQARAQGHLLRAEADAILVGARTVVDDDPELTCRLPGLANRSPRRVVLSSRADLPVMSKLVTSARRHPVWVYCGAQAPAAHVAALEAHGVQVTRVVQVGGQLWLPAIMEALAAGGITRLLVEGGPQVWSAFARAGLVDELVVFRARDDRQPANAAESIATTAARYVGGQAFEVFDARRLPADDMAVLRARRGRLI